MSFNEELNLPYISNLYPTRNINSINLKRLNKSSSTGNLEIINKFNKRNFEYDLYNKIPLSSNINFFEEEMLPFQQNNENILKAYSNYIESKEKIIENNSKNYLLFLTKNLNINKGKFPFENYILNKNNQNHYIKLQKFTPSLIKSYHTDINGKKYYNHEPSSNGIFIGETIENSCQYKNFMDKKKKDYLQYNERIAFQKKNYKLNSKINDYYDYIQKINKKRIYNYSKNNIYSINISNRSERQGIFKNLPLIKRIYFKDNIEFENNN